MRLRKTLARTREAAGFRLRRLPWVHRPLKWIKSSLLGTLGEAGLQLCRVLSPGSLRFGPPRKTFSLYQDLRGGASSAQGRIVLEDQGAPVVAKDSLMVIGGYGQHLEQPWPIFWNRQAEAHLVTESLALLSAQKELCLESVYGAARLRDDPAYRYLHLPEPARLPGNWTSIISRWVPSAHETWSYPNYTHWLLDALPRLALLPEFPADTQILVPQDLHANQKEALAMLGVLDRCRFTAERHLALENYFFSSPTTMLQCYNPYGIEFLRRKFLPKADPAQPVVKKVFIQRLGFTREPENRVAIEQLFLDRGWTMVDIMKLSFAQQIKLFAEADAVAGMFGSGFTNCVFCKPGSLVLPIMPTDFGLDGFLEWIGQVVGYRFKPLIVPGSYTYQFSVDEQAIKEWLDANPV